MSRTTRSATDPDESAAVRFNAGKSSEFRSEALFGSFWIASALVRLMLQECDLDVERFEHGLYARGIRAFVSIRAEKLSKVGRTTSALAGAASSSSGATGGTPGRLGRDEQPRPANP